MEIFRAFGKMLIFTGVVMAALGFVMYFGARLPFRLGHLPGDIVYRGKNTTIYFPVVTCLLLSALVTVVSWLLTHLRR
jgi:hypothetical protein